MAIIKQYHKDTDTTYVYESISYWDEQKKQSRSKRRVIGKLDPQTGEIIPTGKRGPKAKAPSSEVPDRLPQMYEDSQMRVKELTLEIDRKNQEIADLQKEIGKLRGALSQIDGYLAKSRQICTDQLSHC